MPYSDDEEHSPSEFHYPREKMTQMLCVKAKITPNKTTLKTAKKKCFLVFSSKSKQISIQQSHIINPLLTSFARSVRESIASLLRRLVCTKNLRQYFPLHCRPRTRLISP